MLNQYRKLITSLVLATTAMLVSGQENILTSPARGLIYSATADFRHDSIPTAIQALKTQGTSYNITFDQTEDQSWFTDERLAQYDVIVFLQNTGEGERFRLCWMMSCLTPEQSSTSPVKKHWRNT